MRDTQSQEEDCAPNDPTRFVINTRYIDGDGDGALAPALECTNAEIVSEPEDLDCDDDDQERAPNKSEDCNAIDNDCDGVIDNGVCDCQVVQLTFGDGVKSYLVCREEEEYYDAVEKCSEKTNYGIAEFENQIENEEMADVVGQDEGFWIGLERIDSASNHPTESFAWRNMGALNYSDWRRNEPNNNNNNGEDCVEVHRDDNGDGLGWNDKNCETDRFYFCESQLDPVILE